MSREDDSSVSCPACGFASPQGFQFCGHCGQELTALPAAPADGPGDRAERRQLTVLFCDVVDSTRLAERLDPEELRDIIRSYQRICGEVVTRFHGHVAQYLGDGLLVYFGFPAAHEDDPRRAVHAGLRMVAALLRSGDRLAPGLEQPLAVRVGIHTGTVVTGIMGSGPTRERLALGSVPNIAARLQSLAAPGEVVLSADTFRLVEGFFTCRSLGFRRLKGISREIEVYRALGERPVSSRFEALARLDPSGIIGRETERKTLRRRFARAREGRGQVVLIAGDPGLGKSRLIHWLAGELAGEPHLWWSCQCSPYYPNSPFYPLIDFLSTLLGRAPDDSAAHKLAALERLLVELDLPVSEGMALWGALLSLPASAEHPPLETSPQQRKEKTLELFLELFTRRAETHPLVFVVEDLHWLDPSTQELLDRLIERCASARVLVLLTFRPTFDALWNEEEHVQRIDLERLDDEDIETLARRVAGSRVLPPAILQQLVFKADGVPLFVEELTGTVLAAGRLEDGDEMPTLVIPSSLQDSLMARLDGLGPAKMAAQLAAVLGREVAFELLSAVAPWDAETLRGWLRRLVDADLLVRDDRHGVSRYVFRHALIRDAAYGSILIRERRAYHARIGEVIESDFPAIVESHPELVAQHYAEARLPDKAVGFWRTAGLKAAGRFANREAAHLLKQALDSLSHLPESAERDRLELELRTTLGPVLMAVRGFGSPEVEAVYARASELCERVEDTPRLFFTIAGLCRFQTVVARLDRARPLARRMLRMAHHLDDEKRVEAHRSIGGILFLLGKLEQARHHFERGMAIDDARHGRPEASELVHHPGLGCRAYASWVLWHLGHPDRSLRLALETLDRARHMDRPYDLALALSTAALMRFLRREHDASRTLAEEQIALATEHQLAVPLASGKLLCGGALVGQGRESDGLALLRDGVAAWRALGVTANSTFHCGALLAEAYLRTRRVDEGLAAIEEGLRIVDRHGERFWEAGLYQLQGELLLLRPDACRDRIESRFRRARAVARWQRATAFELRAAISLARLHRTGETRRAARESLSRVYARFDEGLDTVDLREARALLEAPDPGSTTGTNAAPRASRR